MQHDGDFSIPDPRSLFASEHFLEAYRQDGQFWLFIVDSEAGSTRHDEMGWSELIEAPMLLIREKALQRWGKVESLEPIERGNASQVWTEPRAHCGQQRFI